MATFSLESFLAKLMDIHATTPGMGGASAGIYGTTSVGDPVVQQLRSAAVAFASAYHAGKDRDTVQLLGKEVEGHIHTLQAMSVITAERSDLLLTELHDLIEQAPASE